MGEWWAYLHTNGTVQVYCFRINRQTDVIADAIKSPFVQKVTGPYRAYDYKDAMDKAIERMGLEIDHG